MNGNYAVLLGLFVAALIIRNGYELLKKAGRVNPESKPLFAVIFAAMCLLWASWFSMCPLDVARFEPSGLVRWIGFGAFVLGWLLAIGAIIQLRGFESIDHLITTGLFSIIRHPMYMGFILWIVGWGLFHGASLSLAAGLLGIGSILFWRRLEDKDLQARYGEQYRTYRKGTWF